jgi:hypothetical protein
LKVERALQIDSRVASISADGAYDTEGVYGVVQAHGEGRAASVRIPPRRGAQLRPRPSAALQERNRNIRSIHRLGRGMRSRTLAGQLVEVQLACRVLNTMTRLGMPDSYRVV